MKEWIEQHLKQQTILHPTHADQYFLAQVLWPKIKDFCTIHDTVHQIDWNSQIPQEIQPITTHSSDALGGFKAKLITITTPEPINSSYLAQLKDNNGNIYFQYERKIINGKDEYYLPTSLWDKTISEGWQLLHLPLTTIES